MAASGMTLLQIVNRILERLRESTVAAYNSTDYSTLITAMVNQVKAEIEEAWYWHALRETYTVSAVVGTSNYALTDSGMNAVVIDGWNTTTNGRMTRGTVRDFDEYYFGTSSVPTNNPTEYIPAGFDANYDLTIDIYPPPASTNTLKFTVYVPQDDLAASATVPLVPQNVLIEETIARLLAERGDEGAPQAQPGSTFIRSDLLAAAVSRDQGRTDSSELDWEVE
jgi:hypothetical protein